MIIDSHHHLWRYDPAEYGWIAGPLVSLRRDFLLGELRVALAEGRVDGTVAVQARQTEAETRWLLQLAQQEPAIRGVVGWLPLAAPDIAERIAAHPALVGLRHVVQGEPAGFLAQPAFNAGVAAVGRAGLVYDLLIHHHQLDEAIAFADRHPQVRMVLDHLAKPPIATGGMQPWAGRMQELAQRPNVWCKLSGLVTEADPAGWSETQLRPYVDLALAAFGPRRLLFGSDWPVCLAGCGYARWRSLVEGWIAPLTDAERRAILGGNAIAVYRLALHQSARTA